MHRYSDFRTQILQDSKSILTFICQGGDEETEADKANGVDHEKDKGHGRVSVGQHGLASAQVDGDKQCVDGTGTNEVDEVLKEPRGPVSCCRHSH